MEPYPVPLPNHLSHMGQRCTDVGFEPMANRRPRTHTHTPFQHAATLVALLPEANSEGLRALGACGSIVLKKVPRLQGTIGHGCRNKPDRSENETDRQE